MRYFTRRAITVLVLAALAGGIPALSHGGIVQAALGPAAGTAQSCPPDPSPRSTVNGNLVVTGTCHLVGVTVTGSITVMPRSDLTLTQSSVGGNVSVQDGNLDSIGSSIRGNINLNIGSAIELAGSMVFGSIYGTGVGARICGSAVRGSINLSITAVTIGDPTDDACASNTIGAGITLSYVISGEVEGNTIGGSADISQSDIDFSLNTVAGNAVCLSNTPFIDGDTARNTVRGSNSCS